MKTILAIALLTLAVGCAGTFRVAPASAPPAATIPMQSTTTTDDQTGNGAAPTSTNRVVAFVLADFVNARTIFAADASLVDPKTGVNYGVQCVERILAHQSELEALLAPIPHPPTFTPAAPVIGAASGVAEIVAKGDARLTYEAALADSESARAAQIRIGIPLDVRAACGMFATTGVDTLAKFGINLPQLGVR